MRLSNVTVLRRYASAPGDEPVVFSLARFSAITRSRVVCASIPLAEMLSALFSSMSAPWSCGAVVERRVEHAKIGLVDVEYQFLGGLTVCNCRKLLVDRHRIAVRGARG